MGREIGTTGALTVSPAQLRANRWNPNVMDQQMYRKELASIRKFGFIDPVTVREADGWFEIIDGEHRWRAAQELLIKEIPIYNVGEISEAQAKQLTIVLNETRGRSDPRKLGAVLQDLLGSEPKADLLDLLPFSPPIFDRLAGIDESAWAEPAPIPGSTWVERTYRMPRDAAEVLDEAIAKIKTQEGGEIVEWQAIEMLAAEFLSGSQ